jgi:hypothetical protein
MDDALAPVVPIRLGPAARYGVAQAMNEICALLVAPAGLIADEVAACVTQIFARAGRSLARARMIASEVTGDREVMPAARADAAGTVVLVSQDRDGPGVLVQLTSRAPGEAAGLVITIDGEAAGRSPGPVRVTGGRPRRRRQRSPAGQGHGLPEWSCEEGALPCPSPT